MLQISAASISSSWLHKLFLASVRVRTPDFFFVYVLTNVLEEKTCTSVLYAHLGKVRRGLKYFLEIFTIISLNTYFYSITQTSVTCL